MEIEAEQGGQLISTHMPLARHDFLAFLTLSAKSGSPRMPLARHDLAHKAGKPYLSNFYSHASCEA